MTVINEPASHYINEEVRKSDKLTMQQIITAEKDMRLGAQYKKPDDEDSLCFVLGYN